MNVIITYIKRILRIKPKQDGITWISADEDEETDEGDELPPKPMFRGGEDEVVLYNPYEGAFMTMDFLSMEPERYRVVDVAYDEEEKVFRYKLDDGMDDLEGIWYSEDWLSLPTVTKFMRVIAEETNTNTKINPGGITMEAINAENAILAKAMDDDLKAREIDRFLDLLRTGNVEERKAAEKELRRLTNTKLGEE